MTKAVVGLAVMVNGLAPAPNTVLVTSTVLERERPFVFESANVAVSADPLGTVAGDQLAGVFQSPLVGLRFQVALSA
jgi:hypothetical protein